MKINKQPLPKKELEKAFNLYLSGEFQSAILEIKSLNELYPNQPLLFNLIGACYKELGELNGAAKMFQTAVMLSPKYAEAYFNLGVIYQDLDNREAAVKNYQKAIQINPNYPEAHNNLGNTYRKLGDLQSSVDSLEWAIAYSPEYPEAFNNLGSTWSELGNLDDAKRCFEKSISLRPNYANAIHNLALLYKDLGNKNKCLELISKVVELKPNWSDAHLNLSRVKTYKKKDPHISLINSYLSNNDLNLKDKINFNFTLAKIYEDIGEYEKQFKHLNKANSLRKEESGYSFDKDEKLFAKIKYVFKNPPLDLKKTAKTNLKPIFIVGMPRSGTSLVHQIISSHKVVYGAGELTKLHKFVNPVIDNSKSNHDRPILKNDLISIREGYLNAISNLNASEEVIVDKMPLNFRYIGFILKALPEAKIIHMERDPMAVCWSIYKYYFPGNTYSYNQVDIANSFLLYKNLMSFWNRVFPNKIYDCVYENLTKNQEKETKKLLKHCDLEWDENCLNFHKNKTVVKTTSSIQVKAKMYEGSSEVWKKYENYLQPLIKGLNYY